LSQNPNLTPNGPSLDVRPNAVLAHQAATAKYIARLWERPQARLDGRDIIVLNDVELGTADEIADRTSPLSVLAVMSQEVV
jgi:hypothetical protein